MEGETHAPTIITLETGDDLLRVTNSFGRSLRTYDTGSGPLWRYIEAGGLEGIIRADDWYLAWETAVDEIMDDATEDDSDGCEEGIHFRGGVPTNPELKNTVAQSDLNGSYLTPLTYEFAKSNDYVVTYRSPDPPEYRDLMREKYPTYGTGEFDLRMLVSGMTTKRHVFLLESTVYNTSTTIPARQVDAYVMEVEDNRYIMHAEYNHPEVSPSEGQPLERDYETLVRDVPYDSVYLYSVDTARKNTLGDETVATVAPNNEPILRNFGVFKCLELAVSYAVSDARKRRFGDEND